MGVLTHLRFQTMLRRITHSLQVMVLMPTLYWFDSNIHQNKFSQWLDPKKKKKKREEEQGRERKEGQTTDWVRESDCCDQRAYTLTPTPTEKLGMTGVSVDADTQIPKAQWPAIPANWWAQDSMRDLVSENKVENNRGRSKIYTSVLQTHACACIHTGTHIL